GRTGGGAVLLRAGGLALAAFTVGQGVGEGGKSGGDIAEHRDVTEQARLGTRHGERARHRGSGSDLVHQSPPSPRDSSSRSDLLDLPDGSALRSCTSALAWSTTIRTVRPAWSVI